MKKRVVWLLIGLLALCGGCGILADDAAVTGIGNFSPHLCSLGLTADLFPGEDFLTSFPYVDSSFVYQDMGTWDHADWGVVRTVAVLTYEPEVYALARECCMGELSLSQERRLSYGGFTFVQNNTQSERYPAASWYYPKRFNLFGWRDESCELMFIGYYGQSGTAMDMLPEDFGGFMEAVFGEFYDFPAE